jgi:hypothetical protein
MVEDVTLVGIYASLVGIFVAHESASSHELVGANKQAYLDVIIIEAHQQANVHTIEE